MVKPLNELKEKKEQTQDNEYQKAFEELKDRITSQPVLTILKREGKFRVETDTLGHGIKVVLSQEQKEKWKTIVFLSKTIQPAML